MCDHISLSSFWNEKYFRRICRKKSKQILCSINVFHSKNHAIYEIMWKNMVYPDRPKMALWRMRIACWMPKATNTHSKYVLLLFLHCNNGCTNGPKCYFTRNLAVSIISYVIFNSKYVFRYLLTYEE
jgi:hypothetical protein